MEIVKKLTGHSGSEVYLITDENGRTYVNKVNNVARNYERLLAVKDILPVPEVYDYDKDLNYLSMEYIPGLDMRTYLKTHSPTKLVNFLTEHIEKLAASSVDKDYADVYNHELRWMDMVSDLPFTRGQLVMRLPRVLPQSVYHGDMTLENIIYGEDGEFHFIDPVTVPWDSWVFDLAKLRQDLQCKWFLRDHSMVRLDEKLREVHGALHAKFPYMNDKPLLILMLLRVYLHCDKSSPEYHFIINEVNRLWK